jgi:type I restriction enzyme S subunit
MSDLIKIPQGLKQTKLGLLPKEWELSTLQDYSENITKGSTPTTYGFAWVESGILFLRSECVSEVGLFLDPAMKISSEANDSLKRSQIKAGDLLMTITGNVGRVIKLPNEFSGGNINQHIARIRINGQNVIVDFVYQYLSQKKIRDKYLTITTGQAYPQISLKQVRDTQIPLPPLPEQRKIAEILSTWDKAIETLQKLIEQKEKLKKGLMQQLLTGNKRLPGFEGEWEEVSLGQVTDRVTTRNSVGCDNVVTISAKRGFVRQEDFFNKRVASKNTENYYLLKNGEFAYNKSYSKGYPMGVIKRQDRYELAVVTTLYQCFKLKESLLDSNYAVHFFNSGILNKGLTRITQEGARAHGLLNISVSDFYDLSFALPTKLEQIAIGKILSIAEQELDSLKEKKRLIVSQKKGLMQQLLTGKTRVKA